MAFIVSSYKEKYLKEPIPHIFRVAQIGFLKPKLFFSYVLIMSDKEGCIFLLPLRYIRLLSI